MAVYCKRSSHEKKKIKFSRFILISIIFLVIGMILKKTDLINVFWGETSIFVFILTLMTGIIYVILNRIMYITQSKIEKVGSWLFYIGLAAIVLRLSSEIIFNKSSYATTFLYEKIHDGIIITLDIGIGLFFVSLILLLFKFRKLFKFISKL